MANEIQPAVEFQALPLEMLIGSPLTAAVKAQCAAAEGTVAFLKANLDEGGAPRMIEFQAVLEPAALPAPAGGGAAPAPAAPRKITVRAPLIAMLPVPALQINDVTIHFKYEVSQVVHDKRETALGVTADASFNVGPFFKATLKGNLTSTTAAENTVNRSGMLDITVRAGQAPTPAGLSNLLAILSRGILEG
jgi:hypothetical protein